MLCTGRLNLGWAGTWSLQQAASHALAARKPCRDLAVGLHDHEAHAHSLPGSEQAQRAGRQNSQRLWVVMDDGRGPLGVLLRRAEPLVHVCLTPQLWGTLDIPRSCSCPWASSLMSFLPLSSERREQSGPWNPASEAQTEAADRDPGRGIQRWAQAEPQGLQGAPPHPS